MLPGMTGLQRTSIARRPRLQSALLGCWAGLVFCFFANATQSRCAEPPRAVLVYRLLEEGGRPLSASQETPFRILSPESLVAAERFVATPISSQLLLTTYDATGFPEKYDYYLLRDGKLIRATLVSADPWMNLAVFRIDTPFPAHFSFSASKSLQVGALVSAAQLDQKSESPSRGSGKIAALFLKPRTTPHLATPASASLHEFGDLVGVESEAILRPGMPMLNASNELSAIATGTSSEGRSLCIAVDTYCTAAIEALTRQSPQEYGFLGLEPGNLKELPNGQDLQGVYVRKTTQHAPAQLAGIREENPRTGEIDVIAEVNGEPIESAERFLLAIGRMPFEATARLTIRRGKMGGEMQTISVEVKLAKRYTSPRRPYLPQLPQNLWRGVTVDHYTAIDDFAARARLVDVEGCVAIIKVAVDSPAWKAGLRPGQFVARIGDDRITDVKEFIRATAKSSGPVKVTTTAWPDGIRLEPQSYEVAP
jgi:S1-C subfamily serine protease